ncbi:MAG TPA: DUF1918 domain-containing protein [Microlunatus sp.]|nr:DUF1918 domain-containing protein [Microlunatus sp.]
MRASVGDRLHFQSNTVGTPEHSALVIETRGEAGAPPYYIRYDDGRETVVYPGPDCRIEHTGVPAAAGEDLDDTV